MPFARPTLTDLRAQVAADISSGLPGSDPLLRFSALKVLGDAEAGLAYLHYGYTDWVSKQSNPFTATGEFLEAWAALKDVFRLAATRATGQITFSGTNGTSIPSGTPIVRGDGVGYTTTVSATESGGVAVVSAIANADATGLTGTFGNCQAGTAMTITSAIAGITSTGSVTTAFTGGADVETDDSLRSRMLQAYQAIPQGGAQNDYVEWALQVAGVTRAWCNPNGFGAGTVVVYPMLDVTESAYGGFPQGTGGVATLEPRLSTKATLDLLAVANHLYPLRPATALVLVEAPVANPIGFSISGVASSLRTAVTAAIAGVFTLYGSPISSTPGQNGTVDLSYIESAIAAVTGSTGFVITSPAANITGTTGQLPTVGTITWS